MDAEKLFERVLQHFDGSPSKLAKAVNETTPAVCNWKARGIPAHKAMAVSVLTGINVREIRPADWQLYWPEKVARKPRKVAAA